MRFYPRNDQSRRDALLGPGHVAQHSERNDLGRRSQHKRYAVGEVAVAVVATGTAAACNESDIVTGGKVLTMTINATSYDKWHPAVLSNPALLTAFPATDGLRAALAANNFVRTSDKVLTLTLPAIGAYDIAADAHYALTLVKELFQLADATVSVADAIVVTAGA